ncbi:MAG: GspH/FimT family pseudopilin [Rhodobacteraceae bacterium]|nr:GspH/FimT family pseudopilin [Paracoccaceae bacterium]
MDAELRGRGRWGGRGFTLVELVVVVAVLAVLATAVTLTGGFARAGGAAEAAGAAFARAVAAARDRALARGEATGLGPLALGWQVMAPDGKGGWAALGPPGRAPGVAWTVAGVALRPAPDADPAPPAILFLPDGRGTPFTLAIADGRAQLSCRTDGWEAPQCTTDRGAGR